jgi:hypothetical protein
MGKRNYESFRYVRKSVLRNGKLEGGVPFLEEWPEYFLSPLIRDSSGPLVTRCFFDVKVIGA